MADSHSDDYPEGGRKEIIDIKVFRNRDGIFRKNVRTSADAVHTEAADGLMLVRITQHVVIQIKRYGLKTYRSPSWHSFFCLRTLVGKVLKSNLLPGIDGLVDCVHDQQILPVFRFYPSLHGSVALQFLGLMLPSQSDDLGDHLLAAFFGNELGGLHRIDQ